MRSSGGCSSSGPKTVGARPDWGGGRGRLSLGWWSLHVLGSARLSALLPLASVFSASLSLRLPPPLPCTSPVPARMPHSGPSSRPPTWRLHRRSPTPTRTLHPPLPTDPSPALNRFLLSRSLAQTPPQTAHMQCPPFSPSQSLSLPLTHPWPYARPPPARPHDPPPPPIFFLRRPAIARHLRDRTASHRALLRQNRRRGTRAGNNTRIRQPDAARRLHRR